MRTGAGPVAHAAVDLLLQLLLYCRRSPLIDSCAHLMALLDGPTALAAIGRAALERGAQLCSSECSLPVKLLP